MTLWCCLLSLAIAGPPKGSGDTGTPKDTGTTTSTASGSTGSTGSTGSPDTGTASGRSAAEIAGEEGGCHCEHGSRSGGAPLALVALLALRRRRR